jgi:putative addiction module CopG family antidote
MQRIKLGKPYDDYIAQQIESGYFASATEVLRDALRPKMEIPNTLITKKTLLELVKEGEESIKAGRTVPYDEHFWPNIRKKGEEKLKQGTPIPDYILP